MRLAFLIPPMMLLAACGSEEKTSAEGTQVSINAGDEHGGVQIKAGKDGGNIKIGGEGASIDIDIPDFVDLDIESDFDIDGVKLYPGSKVTKVDVDVEKLPVHTSDFAAPFELLGFEPGFGYVVHDGDINNPFANGTPESAAFAEENVLLGSEDL